MPGRRLLEAGNGADLNGLAGCRGEASRGPRQLAELGDHLECLSGLRQARQIFELVVEPDRIDRAARAAEDLRVGSGHSVFPTPPELLVELLARPRADELDRDLALGLLPGQRDHVA